MNRKSLLTWATVGIFSTLVSTELALANHYTPRSSARARAEIRSDWAEIRRDRAELDRNIEEFYQSRADLRRALRRGAPPDVVARRRAEVRQDLREIAQSERELARDYQELREDMDKYGWYRRSDGSWYRYPRSYDRYGGWPWWR